MFQAATPRPSLPVDRVTETQAQGVVSAIAEPVSAVDFARTTAHVESLSNQLAAQRELTQQILTTVDSVLTFHTAALAVLIAVLGLLGWINLRSHVTTYVEAKVDEQWADTTDHKVDTFLSEKEREWDERFEKLLRRVRRLS